MRSLAPESVTQGSKSEMVEELKFIIGILACAKLDEEEETSSVVRCPYV